MGKFALPADQRCQGNGEPGVNLDPVVLRRAVSAGPCRRKETLAVCGAERQGLGDQPDRGQMRRPSHTAFQVADAAQAHPGAIRQVLLRETGGLPHLSEAFRERGRKTVHRAPHRSGCWRKQGPLRESGVYRLSPGCKAAIAWSLRG
jgi:hypothetical protein